MTAEPYIYENEVNGWKKPVKFLLLDKEVPIYQDTLVDSRRQARGRIARACRGWCRCCSESSIDYVKNPGPINAMLVDYTVEDQRRHADLRRRRRRRGRRRWLSLGIVANGTDGVFGSYDTARVQTLINDYGPVFAAQRQSPQSTACSRPTSSPTSSWTRTSIYELSAVSSWPMTKNSRQNS